MWNEAPLGRNLESMYLSLNVHRLEKSRNTVLNSLPKAEALPRIDIKDFREAYDDINTSNF